MRKHTIIYCFIFLLSTTILPAQTVVVTDDSTYVSGQASAVLDLKSTTKGFLPPRVTAAQKDAISSPATGLMVYQTDGIAGYYLWTGTVWDLLVSGLGGVNPVSKTASTTLTQTETFVLASNNITLTLPVVTSAENGLSITVKNIGTVTDLVQVDGNGTATIDGSTGVSNHTRWQAKTYVAHEGNWVLTAAADAGTLSSTMLAGNVVSSSLTSLGILTGLTVTNPIAGSITGNAATATALQTSRAINGVNFNGTTDITITVTAAAETLTGTTLASNVTGSSLTSVGTLTGLTVSSAINGSVTGSAATVTAASQPNITTLGSLVSISTITTGVWNGTTIAAANGGTGVANSNTITLGGNINTAGAISTVGANSLTLTTTGTTNVTLPTSGTLEIVPKLLQLSSDVNLSSVTLTNVTGLNTFSLDAGSTYYFRFKCLVQTNATNVGILLTLNASAAVSSINFITKWPTSATAYSYDNFTVLQGGTLPTTGPGATNAEYLLEGTVVTTGAVTFSLQQRSETATQTTVKAGSLGIVQKL
ncbi:MAG: hypothetical protein Q8K66_06115 [Sediminibacterium sp.]|nr:hypothetical protein [Sediminibacterium sp.]